MSRIDELIQQYCPNGVEYKTLWRWRRMYFGGQELSGNRQQGEEECGRPRIGTDRHYFMGRPHCFSVSRIVVFRAFRGSKDIFLENSPFTSVHVAGKKKRASSFRGRRVLNVSYC